MATLYAAIANGGKLWLPQIVERVESPEGKVLEEFAPRVRRELAVSPETLAASGRRWSASSTSPRARPTRRGPRTSRSPARPAPPRCRAPTQRAGATSRATHAWFAGFAPAGRPEIAVAVLVEHGGHGGDVAAPLAMEIIDNYFETVAPGDRDAPHAGLPRRRGPRPAETPTGAPAPGAPRPTPAPPAPAGGAP